MNKIVYHDCVQGTEEWLGLRLGKITASNLTKLGTNTRSGGLLKSSHDYVMDLASERLTRVSCVNHIVGTLPALQWGNDHEPEAKRELSKHSLMVKNVGCFELDDSFVCSPDGLVDVDGITVPVEIKCPYNPRRHIQNVINNHVPDEYVRQVQAQIFVTNAPFGFFVSYDWRCKDAPLWIIKVLRDDVEINKILEDVQIAEKSICEIVDKFRISTAPF